MSSPDIHENDPLGRLLTVGDAPESASTRRRVLSATLSVVRRRRLARRVGLVTALAAVYVAGIATHLAWVGRSGASDVPLVRQGPAHEEPTGKPPGGQARPLPVRPESPTTSEHPVPSAKERKDRAVASADFDRIRTVGDRYLHQRHDLAGALHFYARALDRASQDQQAISISADDSWLLMALKQARIEQEQNDEPEIPEST